MQVDLQPQCEALVAESKTFSTPVVPPVLRQPLAIHSPPRTASFLFDRVGSLRLGLKQLLSDTNPYVELGRLVAAGIAGGLVGSWVAHKFTAGREKAAGRASRKRDFLAFMQSWKVEIGRKYLEVGGFARDPSSFYDVVSSFAAECESIRADLSNKKATELDFLLSKVVACTGGELNNKEGREKIERLFDSIIQLVKSA